MSRRFTSLLAFVVVALLAMACQPVMPETEMAAPALATYEDPDGLYTFDYPEGWIVDAEFQETFESPFPGLALGSNEEILDTSMNFEPLPEGEIGIAMMLVPSAMFAEEGINPDASLEELVSVFIVGAATEGMDPEALLAEAEISSFTLADGREAARAFTGIETEDYELTLIDMGDGIYLFAPQILAVDYRDAELEAEVDAILESFAFTGSPDAVVEYVMAQMEAMGASE
jgi:hypothetical protein